MTHPAFTTSFENREMFGWPTQKPELAAVTLSPTQWTALICLLSVHERKPVMSPYDSQTLSGALKQIRRQLDNA